MSKLTHADKTLRSYVAGFALSLLYTFIPYYMVVNQTITGQALLITILIFAVVQTIIQVIFFLHLGRGPKPNWNLYFFVATVGIILVVVGGSLIIINNLHGKMTPYEQTKALIDREGIYQVGGEKTGACHGQYDNHQVIIENGKVTPSTTVATKCDTLTFINKDDVTREMTFGTHPEHKSYAGKNELKLSKGKPKTITLSESGNFRFHDHLRPETSGNLLVVNVDQ